MSSTQITGNATSGTTPFPNLLLDAAMHRLKDTEWRVLCVIVRQTCGWKANDRHSASAQGQSHPGHSHRIRQTDRKNQNGRKRRDWITREQLKIRTGRDSEALAKAIDALVRQSYIVAENEAGQPLSTPEARRCNHARVYYRLASRFHPNAQPPKIEHQAGSLSSVLPGVQRQSEHESTGKANTTKEKQTKETVTKDKDVKKTVSQVFDKHSLKEAALELFGDTPSNAADKSIQASLPYGLPQSSDAAQQVVALFRRCALQIQDNEPDLMLSIVDAERLENLVASHPSLDWAPVFKAFFASDYVYVARRSHSLAAFIDSCQIFLVRFTGNRHSTERRSA